jgi:hypothetical protein
MQSALLETKELMKLDIAIKRANEKAGVQRLVGAGVCAISEVVVAGVVASACRC